MWTFVPEDYRALVRGTTMNKMTAEKQKRMAERSATVSGVLGEGVAMAKVLVSGTDEWTTGEGVEI
jgi:hypothetical protein